MGLELNKLSKQVNKMGATVASRSAEIEARLPKARATLKKITNNDPELKKKIKRALLNIHKLYFQIFLIELSKKNNNQLKKIES